MHLAVIKQAKECIKIRINQNDYYNSTATPAAVVVVAVEVPASNTNTYWYILH